MIAFKNEIGQAILAMAEGRDEPRNWDSYPRNEVQPESARCCNWRRVVV
jgi:hypothetical protein